MCGKVERRVLAEDVHDLVAVHAKLLAQIADFVGKGDLECVKGIGHVLHHLSGPERGSYEGRLDVSIKTGDPVPARLVRLSNNSKWRMMVVTNRSPLSHELR